jgi:ribosomal protein S18 acetylase RimI-like enzyme
MVEYRIAEEKDVDELAQMVSETFGEYPLFDIVLRDSFKDVSEYTNFTKELHKVHIRSFIRKHICFVGVVKSSICSMALLEEPNGKKVSIWDYIKAGGLELIPRIGLQKLLAMKTVEEEARREITQVYDEAWYIEMLTVHQKFKGQQLGSKIINDCIIPYINEHGGSKVTLVTNTELNRKFYVKNGFLELFESTIKRKGKETKNWSYLRELELPIKQCV